MFKHKKVSANIQHDISSHEILNIMLTEFNGLLAGGAAYSVYHGNLIRDHLLKHETADLDIYFPNEETYKAAVEHVINMSKYVETISLHDYPRPNIIISKSVTGLCHNVWSDNHNMQIQLVGCVFGSYQEIVESFDFKNLEVGYYFKDNSYCELSSKNARNTKMLAIRHTRSPFLMHRIYKYISYRGFQGVTNDSRKHVTDWIVKASSGYYYENKDRCPSIYVNLLDNFGLKKLLKESDVISDHDLVYMIGKIRETEYKYIEIENYISSSGYRFSTGKEKVTRDVIIEEMKKRELKNGN